MAFSHGKDAYFALDNSAGSLIDLSSYTDSVTTDDGVSLADVTTFGDQAEAFVAGLVSMPINVGGSYDPTVATHFSGLRQLTATSTFSIGPAGSTSASPRITGECWLEKFNVSVGNGDANKWSATLRLDTTPATYDTFP